MKTKDCLFILIFVLMISMPFVSIGVAKNKKDMNTYNITSTVINCKSNSYCLSFKQKVSYILGKTYEIDGLKNELRSLLLDPSIKNFSYKLYGDREDIVLEIDVGFRSIVKKVIINNVRSSSVAALRPLLNVSVGKFYSEVDMRKSKIIIRKWFLEQGYVDVNVTNKVSSVGEFVRLEYDVSHSGTVKIKDVVLFVDNNELKSVLRRKFIRYIGKSWRRLDVKLAIDRVSEKLIGDGFLLSSVERLPPLLVKENNVRLVTLRVQVKQGRRFAFSFYGNKRVNTDDLKKIIKRGIRNRTGQLLAEDFKDIIVDEYKRQGMYSTGVIVKIIEGEDQYGVLYKHLFLKIEEKEYVSVKELTFKGVSFEHQSHLLDIYYDDASDLVSSGFLDENYLKLFREKVLRRMYSKGYVWAKITLPRISWLEEGDVSIEFEVDQGRECYIESISLGDDTPPKLINEIKENLENKKGKTLNLLLVQADMDKAIAIVKDNGFLFAAMLNEEVGTVVKYNYNYTRVGIDFNIKLGPRIKLGSVIISGNSKTKKEVLLREIHLKKGDVVSQKIINQIRKKLVSLGIFSLVEITPVIVTSDSTTTNEAVVNLVIYIKEKKFGSVEIAPGYRTDIGVKLSAMVTYNNLNGMNRIVSVKGMANERLDFDNFDDRRKSERVRKIEYAFDIGYIEPYLLGIPLMGELSTSGHSKRFYSFDAKILKLAGKIRKKFLNTVSTSLKYQFESIKQTDATDDKDEGIFKIGSITPSISLDLRDNSLNPTSGLFMGVSYEVAKHAFGAMSNDRLKVEYTRFISRNKLYVPFAKKWVLAFFAAFGIEKNLANGVKLDNTGAVDYDEDGSVVTEGYIPSVKVFRLNGFDQIRGFNDAESNFLFSGNDISDVAIRNKAFFSNFKIEQRYFNSENTMIGLFLDAGRVFVDHFVPFKVRTAVGVSFKYITPVGSLNLEYGVKTRRHRVSERRDSMGRLHLTIGSF